MKGEGGEGRGGAQQDLTGDDGGGDQRAAGGCSWWSFGGKEVHRFWNRGDTGGAELGAGRFSASFAAGSGNCFLDYSLVNYF